MNEFHKALSIPTLKTGLDGVLVIWDWEWLSFDSDKAGKSLSDEHSNSSVDE